VGGFNSGRRTGRPAVEDGFTLNLPRLFKQRFVWPGCVVSGSVRWTSTRTGEQRAVIGYEADFSARDSGWMRLRYSINGKSQDYVVQLRTTECHYGGRRWWFLCPSSWRRCTTLHLPPGGTIFAARQAYRLAYRSQREGPMDRSHDRQRRLYARLGTEYRFFEQSIPARPKGMRQATYDRLVAEIEGAMERHEDIFIAGAERFLGKLGGL
jgi:hypothetical protein